MIARVLALILTCLTLGACGAAESVWSSDQDVIAARHISAEPPYVALVTMIAKKNEFGAHSALLVNGSEVVMYDPAGTYKHERTPERNDVFYGMTPTMVEVYQYYHARNSHYVLEHKLPVSRDFADRVIARMQTQGASPKMYCGINTSEILRDFPEFAHIPRSFYPGEIMKAFAQIPGVVTKRIDDGDVGQNFVLVKSNDGGT